MAFNGLADLPLNRVELHVACNTMLLRGRGEGGERERRQGERRRERGGGGKEGGRNVKISQTAHSRACVG